MEQQGRLRVLIAEDSSVSAKVLAKAVSDLGHVPTITHSGEDAWQELQAFDYPVVLTDWVMPGMEGPELCSRIRALEGRGYTYVIMLTAKGDREDRIAAMTAGADDFLCKPLDRAELSARLAVAQRIISMQQRLEDANRSLQDQQEELKLALDRVERSSKVAEMSQKRFSQLFEGLPVPTFTLDANLKLYEMNKRALATFDCAHHDAFERSVADVLGSDLINTDAETALRGLFRNEPFSDREWFDGERTFIASGLPLLGPDGGIVGGIVTLVDVTAARKAEQEVERQLVEINEAHAQLETANQELKELNERLNALATEDGLTGIANHRAFQERLNTLVGEGKRGRAFCLALLDVDNFKSFNDSFGHQAGDEVLKAVAACLKSSLRETDFVARYGGEEFCVLLLDVSCERAGELCDVLRAGIEALSNPHRQVTASFGVAEFGGSISDGEALIRASDEALYQAKAEGRNRVVLASRRSGQSAA